MRDVRLEQLQQREWSSQIEGDVWSDGARLVEFMRSDTNQFDAARDFAWDRVIGHDGATVLDLGCGSGWLTALLSRHPRVERVIAWDGSPTLLEERLPQVVEVLDGRMERIERVCGSFSPLPIDDASLELVVMASAFHHADAPGELLDDLARIVRPGGAIVLANELIWPRSWTFLHLGRTMAAAGLSALTPRARVSVPGHVSADHILYDDELGDRAYTAAQWQRLLAGHGLSVELVDSGLPPYKPHFRRRGIGQGNLVHWVLRRAA